MEPQYIIFPIFLLIVFKWRSVKISFVVLGAVMNLDAHLTYCLGCACVLTGCGFNGYFHNLFFLKD